jgi:hypothetical protein
MIQHTMTRGGFESEPPAAMWNTYLVGIAVILVAGAALIAFQTWKEWTNIALGGWLLLSPWVMGFSSATALTWNAIIAGAIVVALAGWATRTATPQEQSRL